ncbi:glycoside hydrolase family 88 protein [Phaeodactylibacter xiamenensis]|uniref:glycoside hydrolase family 88 protein n=1 Tax=Phaeodactylibacter xiamenensis TaxID=1524460 RepID=UPI0024A868A0|nr:glycoside hydrolase family 88 protein [Phaeodactylibacter xiamenensis]
MKYFPFFLILLLAGSCAEPAGEADAQLLEPAFDLDSLTEVAARQYAKTLETLPDTNRIPRNAHPDGTWNLVKKGNWVSGFYPGVLWHLYALTGDEKWKEAGEAELLKLDSVQFFDYDHDIGFRIFNSFGSALRFTKDSSYVPVIVDAAKTLKTRYRPVTGVIRSWDWHDQWQYPVIIDNMMNLELLFWAARQTGDAEMETIAISHAEHTMDNHFRDDYSTYHVLDYDTLSGSVREKVTFQGYADSSMWARGQAWAIYGFTLTARETGRADFLKQAQSAADIFLKRLPEDGVPYWDFDAPGIPDEPKDASAAAIAASALLELSQLVEAADDQYRYHNAAIALLNALATPEYLAALPQQGLLLHSTGHKPGNSEIDEHIIYADYYFLEALLRLKELQPPTE